MYSPRTTYAEYLRGEQAKYPELKLEDIEKLKDSLADDQRIPPISDKKYLAFLHSCNFDVELAKKTIQRSFRFHFEIPQLFCELDPLAEDIEENYKCLSVGQLPTTNLDKNERILYVQFKDMDHEAFDFMTFYKYLAIWVEYTLMCFGTCDGLIAVVDSHGLTWRDIIKIPIGITAKMIKYTEVGLPARLKSIHILNAGSAAQMLMKITTRFANQELLEKIILHSPGSDDIFNYVSKNVMPVECGGLGKSHNHYSDEMYNNIIDIRDEYLGNNEMMANHMMYMNQSLIEEKEK